MGQLFFVRLVVTRWGSVVLVPLGVVSCLALGGRSSRFCFCFAFIGAFLGPNRQAQEHEAAAAGAGERRTARERSFHLKLIGAIHGQYCTDIAEPQRLS
jgi:hypothetical protein